MFRGRLEDYLGNCLRAGIRGKQFAKAPVPDTVNLLIALVNGLLRQRVAGLTADKDLRAVASEVAGADLSGFFDRYVQGEQQVDLGAL